MENYITIKCSELPSGVIYPFKQITFRIPQFSPAPEREVEVQPHPVTLPDTKPSTLPSPIPEEWACPGPKVDPTPKAF